MTCACATEARCLCGELRPRSPELGCRFVESPECGRPLRREEAPNSHNRGNGCGLNWNHTDQMEGAIFDVPCGEMSTPRSLDHAKQKFILQLVEDLNPLLSGLYDLINQDTGGASADELFMIHRMPRSGPRHVEVGNKIYR